MELKLKFPQPYIRVLWISGFIGLLAAFIVGTGELLLHYSSGGYSFDVPYAMFNFVSSQRLIAGHFLVVAGLPLYLIGYLHIYLFLRPGSEKLAAVFLFFGVVSFIVGGIWIGSRAMLGFMYQELSEPPYLEVYRVLVERYQFLLESLVKSLRFIVLFNSILFVFIILKKDTLYPKWMAFFNPVLWLGVVFILFFTLPALGNYLAPTAMNVAHIIVFTASLIALKKLKPT